MAADGSIIFSTALDNKQLMRELANTEKEIHKLEEKLRGKEAERSPYIKQAEELQAKISAATKEAQQYATQWRSGELGADRQEMAALEQAKALRAEHSGVLDKVEKYDNAIDKVNVELDRQKDKAGAIVLELEKANNLSGRMGEAVNQADAYMDKFLTRVKQLAKRALVFYVISAGLRAMRQWLGKVVQTNSEATAALAKLKAALLVMAQPLVEVIIPAFTRFVTLLAAIATQVARVLSAIFGGSLAQSTASAKALDAQTKALKGTGAAAEKARKQLAGFDELNVLSAKEDASAGGGGGGFSDITPDFSSFDTATAGLENMLDLVKAVAAGLLAWKISSMFTDNLKTSIGLAMAVAGGIILIDGYMDAWDKGVNTDNLVKMLGGLALLVGGLALAFGATAAGIALVVGGIAFLVLAFKDIIENGANLQNTLLLIAGIIATGLGIAILTGSWIPLVIAAIAAVILAIVAIEGNLDELFAHFKTIFSGITKFIAGVFTGDWEKAWEGIKDIFKGIFNSVIVIFESVLNLIIDGLNFLVKKANTLIDKVPGNVIPNIPSIPKFNIPRLATGAVIPPNREFLAVLGDQRHGRNLEGPEGLFRQMLQEEVGGMLQNRGGSGEEKAVITLDGRVLGEFVIRYINDKTQLDNMSPIMF